MARPKPIVIPGTFMEAVERLIKTAPPPKGADLKAVKKANADLEKATQEAGWKAPRKGARKTTRKKAR